MTGANGQIWMPLAFLIYAATALYWARVAALENRNHETYFSAGHSLSPWIASLILAGASISSWFLLAGSAEIGQRGFSLPALLQGGVALALPGVVFFKRMWFVCQRLRLSSQAELFRSYYGSEFLVLVSTAIAVLFAVAFAGQQTRALAHIIATLSGDQVSPLVVSAALGFMLFGYVAIGGMRAVGYFGVLQTVLLWAAIAGFAGYTLVAIGGFEALNLRLQTLARSPDGAHLFSVAGVIRFSAGLGRGGEVGDADTAMMSFGLALAFMGLQASPLAAKIVLSTNNARGFAAGQTWVMAGAFGALIVFGVGAIGAGLLVAPSLSVEGALAALETASPWFMAWLLIGVVAGAQVLAGLALLTAGESLVRNVYKPYFHASLSRRDTVNLTRAAIGVMAIGSVLMQALTPVTLSAFASVALPMSLQLWTPLLGVAWLRWITRPAAATGVAFGLAGVFLTEPLGYECLSFFGLELPWGRWPWTMHSAVWGLAANLGTTLVISAIANRDALSEEALEVRRFLKGALRSSARAQSLSATAWAVSLAWLFLAVGPGLEFGNLAFGVPGVGRGWILSMPSLWAWTGVFWALGVGLIWFLAYKMEMASPVTAAIEPYQPRPRLRLDQSQRERERLRAAIIVGSVGFGLAVLIAFSFGR